MLKAGIGRAKHKQAITGIPGAEYAVSSPGQPALCQNTTAVYHPRKPTDSPLYRLLQSHFDHF